MIKAVLLVPALVVACSAGGPGAATFGGATETTVSGCFSSDAADIYRSTDLCLGPPSLEEGRFELRESQVVPDATLSESYRGTYERQGDRIVLRADRSQSQTVNEQLESVSQGRETAANEEWWLTGDGRATPLTLHRNDGSAVELSARK